MKIYSGNLCQMKIVKILMLEICEKHLNEIVSENGRMRIAVFLN